MKFDRGHGLRGLYVITDNTLIGGDRLIPAVRAAISGGARIVQYRDKGRDAERRLTEASALLALCREAAVPLIINDDIELAASIGAEGVHLGAEDDKPQTARARLGEKAIIGISCYNQLSAPHIQYADYVAFGRLFPSATKPDAPAASLDIITRARATLDKPVAAIGGINTSNGRAVIEAGADMLAVVGGVFGSDDPSAAAAAIAGLFPET